MSMRHAYQQGSFSTRKVTNKYDIDADNKYYSDSYEQEMYTEGNRSPDAIDKDERQSRMRKRNNIRKYPQMYEEIIHSGESSVYLQRDKVKNQSSLTDMNDNTSFIQHDNEDMDDEKSYMSCLEEAEKKINEAQILISSSMSPAFNGIIQKPFLSESIRMPQRFRDRDEQRKREKSYEETSLDSNRSSDSITSSHQESLDMHSKSERNEFQIFSSMKQRDWQSCKTQKKRIRSSPKGYRDEYYRAIGESKTNENRIDNYFRCKHDNENREKYQNDVPSHLSNHYQKIDKISQTGQQKTNLNIESAHICRNPLSELENFGNLSEDKYSCRSNVEDWSQTRNFNLKNDSHSLTESSPTHCVESARDHESILQSPKLKESSKDKAKLINELNAKIKEMKCNLEKEKIQSSKRIAQINILEKALNDERVKNNDKMKKLEKIIINVGVTILGNNKMEQINHDSKLNLEEIILGIEAAYIQIDKNVRSLMEEKCKMSDEIRSQFLQISTLEQAKAVEKGKMRSLYDELDSLKNKQMKNIKDLKKYNKQEPHHGKIHKSTKMSNTIHNKKNDEKVLALHENSNYQINDDLRHTSNDNLGNSTSDDNQFSKRKRAMYKNNFKPNNDDIAISFTQTDVSVDENVPCQVIRCIKKKSSQENRQSNNYESNTTMKRELNRNESGLTSNSSIYHNVQNNFLNVTRAPMQRNVSAVSNTSMGSKYRRQSGHDLDTYCEPKLVHHNDPRDNREYNNDFSETNIYEKPSFTRSGMTYDDKYSVSNVDATRSIHKVSSEENYNVIHDIGFNRDNIERSKSKIAKISEDSFPSKLYDRNDDKYLGKGKHDRQNTFRKKQFSGGLKVAAHVPKHASYRNDHRDNVFHEIVNPVNDMVWETCHQDTTI